MAAGEVATVFLETSLGTRLALSFPASATTVADLKRRVGDEHAAAFPHIGHIAVQAIKVNQRGSLYHLTDSMAVRDAFRGVADAWLLQVDALPRSALHVAQGRMAQPQAQVPHGCNCNHSSAIHSEPVAACHQHECGEGPSSRSFALGCRKRSVREMLPDQAELGATHAERASREKHRAIKRRDTVPAAPDVGLLCVHKEPCSMTGKNMCNVANSKEDIHLAPCVDELKEGHPSEKETGTAKEPCADVEEKEPFTANMRDGDGSSQGSPCAAETTKERDSSENEAMQHKFEEKETWTGNVCNHESSTKETDLPPCDELIKEVDSSESEAMQHKLEEMETRANRVCNGERSGNGPDLPQCTKERDSYEKEAMTRRVEEEEPWKARVWNGERSSQATDLPPPCVAESTKEGDSSKKEAMQHKAEEKETWTTRVCNGEGGNNGIDLPPPFATESTKEGDSSEEQAMQHKFEEKVCDRESSSNWTDLSPGDESMNEGDSSDNEVMQHEVEEKEPWTAKVCKGEGSSHWNDPIEWTDAEKRAWEMALEKRRRPRIAVRKMPNSRAARLYGYR